MRQPDDTLYLLFLAAHCIRRQAGALFPPYLLKVDDSITRVAAGCFFYLLFVALFAPIYQYMKKVRSSSSDGTVTLSYPDTS